MRPALCPICGTQAMIRTHPNKDNTIVDCPRCGQFEVTHEFLEGTKMQKLSPGTPIYRKIERWLWENKDLNDRIVMLDGSRETDRSNESVLDWKRIDHLYADKRTITQRINLALRRIYQLTPQLGQVLNFEDHRWVFPTMDDKEAKEIFEELQRLGFIEKASADGKLAFKMTARGAEKAESLNLTESKQQDTRHDDSAIKQKKVQQKTLSDQEQLDKDIRIVIREVFNHFLEYNEWPATNEIWFSLRDTLVSRWHDIIRGLQKLGVQGSLIEDQSEPIVLSASSIYQIGTPQANAEIERFVRAMDYFGRKRSENRDLKTKLTVNADELRRELSATKDEFRCTSLLLKREHWGGSEEAGEGLFDFVLIPTTARFAGVKSFEAYLKIKRGEKDEESSSEPYKDKGSIPAQEPSGQQDTTDLELVSGQVSRYANDGPEGGKDELGFKEQVDALAKLIAYKNLKPPLAVGLFGHWGAGKTFFLRFLKSRIEACEESGQIARNKGEKTAYCQRVAKIEFNAWHYVDASLMASLVAHIFDKLADFTGDPKKSPAQKRMELLTAIDERIVKKSRIQEELRRAEMKSADAQRSLDEAQKRAEEEKIALKRINLGDFLDLALIDEGSGNEVEQRRKNISVLAERLGLTEVAGTAREALALRDEINKTSHQIRHVTKHFASVPSSWILVFLILVAAATPLVLWLLFDKQGIEVIASVGVLICGIAAKVTWAIGAVRSVVKKIGNHAAEIERVENTVRQRSDYLVREHQRLLNEAKGDVHKSREELEQADMELEQMKAAVAELSVRSRMLRFIQERAECQDYKRHLGLPAIVRRDLYALADLFKEKRKEREERQRAEVQRREEDKDVIKDENGTSEYNVDRIVLFVDDLDRCPSDHVVRVLETIHLLLAFDLFVVVVAVDPRWLQRSLAKHYPDLLASPKSEAEHGTNLTSDSLPASPQDYLEKIFQIPVSVRRMKKSGYENLIAFMVKETEQADKDASDTQASKDSDKKSEDGAAQSPSQGDLVHANITIPKALDDWTRDIPEPNPALLGVKKEEIGALSKLYPFIQTPRSAKRLINLYQLLKASIPKTLNEEFQNGDPQGYLACMLLLAAQVGYPRETELLNRILGRWSPNAQSWHELLIFLASPESVPLSDEAVPKEVQDEIQRMIEAMEPNIRERWRQLIGNIQQAMVVFFQQRDFLPKSFQRWARIVRLYSFYSYLEPEEEFLFGEVEVMEESESAGS